MAGRAFLLSSFIQCLPTRPLSFLKEKHSFTLKKKDGAWSQSQNDTQGKGLAKFCLAVFEHQKNSSVFYES